MIVKYLLTTSVLILTTAILSGCLSTTLNVNWDSKYNIPVGSQVVLKKSMTIPANDTQIFLQENLASKASSFKSSYDEYHPFCFFEVNTLLDEPQTIEPDTFEVIDVYFYEQEVVQIQPVRLASLITIPVSSEDVSPPMIVKTTTLKLKSTKQPDVRKLECGGGFDYEPFVRPATLREIQLALGEIASIRIPR